MDSDQEILLASASENHAGEDGTRNKARQNTPTRTRTRGTGNNNPNEFAAQRNAGPARQLVLTAGREAENRTSQEKHCVRTRNIPSEAEQWT